MPHGRVGSLLHVRCVRVGRMVLVMQIMHPDSLLPWPEKRRCERLSTISLCHRHLRIHLCHLAVPLRVLDEGNVEGACCTTVR